MCNQDKRNSNPEIPLFRLVPENKHSNNRTGASAKGCKEKQGLFRNPPFAPLCAFLIRPERKKSSQIDRRKIDDQADQYPFLIHIRNHLKNRSWVFFQVSQFAALSSLSPVRR